jgi:hypothetical protein
VVDLLGIVLSITVGSLFVLVLPFTRTWHDRLSSAVGFLTSWLFVLPFASVSSVWLSADLYPTACQIARVPPQNVPRFGELAEFLQDRRDG